MLPPDFRARILRCLDKGLDSIGETGKKVLYWHLVNTFGVKPEELVEKPEKLTDALKQMYGPAAVILESNIAREIAREFGLRKTPTSFAEAVELAKAAARA